MNETETVEQASPLMQAIARFDEEAKGLTSAAFRLDSEGTDGARRLAAIKVRAARAALDELAETGGLITKRKPK